MSIHSILASSQQGHAEDQDPISVEYNYIIGSSVIYSIAAKTH
jgi:hypothetical protein